METCTQQKEYLEFSQNVTQTSVSVSATLKCFFKYIYKLKYKNISEIPTSILLTIHSLIVTKMLYE